MYKLRRTITANTDPIKSTALSSEAKYSSKDIHDFLLSIEELHGYKITAVDNNDGSCKFIIGNTEYLLAPDIIQPSYNSLHIKGKAIETAVAVPMAFY